MTLMTTVEAVDILFVFAHPDDESFGNAGTMLLANAMGLRTGLVCATRGEAGEISDETRAHPQILGAVREHELRRAMALAHLDELRVLPYRDSGMAGTPENNDPRALTNANRDEVTAFIVAAIRDLRPEAVVTFGADGIYGHPDHVFIGSVADDAVRRAGENVDPGLGDPWTVDAVYHVAVSRERVQRMAEDPESSFARMSPELLENFGTPDADITHRIDVSSVLRQKHAILLQHHSQLGLDNPIRQFDETQFRAFLGAEIYTRVPELSGGDIEHDPVSRIRDAHPLALD